MVSRVRGWNLSPLSSGTTEKIFEEKKDLYDVYVDNQNVKTYRDGLKPLLRLSTADREKYRKLTEQRYRNITCTLSNVDQSRGFS